MKIKKQKRNRWPISPSQGGPASPSQGGLVSPKLQRSEGGFTLVELMVATFIFMMIMLASMGALLVTIDSARNARGLRTAMDNVNFAMESMTRSIRMGTNYHCVAGEDGINMTDEPPYETRDCSFSEPGTFVAFIPQKTLNNNRIGYKLHDRKNGSYSLQRCEGTSCVDVVAPEVNIEKLNFVVRGSGSNDEEQASVYIIMKGEVDVKGNKTPFAIQTMASQRNF